jgi:Fe-S-cluster containining protein
VKKLKPQKKKIRTDGNKYIVASMEKNDRRMGRRLLQVYEELDPLIQDAATKMKAQCRAGCASCCHLFNLISFPEAVAIAEYIVKHDGLRRTIPQITQKLTIQLKDVDLSGDSKKARQSYFEKQHACVFLNSATSLCTIYPVRPMTCRSHYVVSDPKSCQVQETGDVASLDLRDMELYVASEASHVSKQCGVDFLMGPFQVMVMWAIKLLVDGRRPTMQATEDEKLGPLNLKAWTVVNFDPSKIADKYAKEKPQDGNGSQGSPG